MEIILFLESMDDFYLRVVKIPPQTNDRVPAGEHIRERTMK